LAPTIVAPLKLKGTLPVLLSITGLLALGVATFWLANTSAVGVPLADNAIPVPLNATDCIPAESLILSIADLLPDVFGLNVTLTKQLAPTANKAGQLLVCVKAGALIPTIVALVKLNGPNPVLLNVTA
jgi:hypothetical protein